MNEPLLYAALVDLTLHPEKHDQDIWLEKRVCGTFMCLAGDVVLLAGIPLEWVLRYERYGHMPVWKAVCILGSSQLTIREAATSVLGIINDCDAEDLFADVNNIDDLWALASVMTDGRVSRPEGL